MGPGRSARARPATTYADSDSGGDTEPDETPRKRTGKSLSKRRLSEFIEPDNDASFSSETGRAPFKAVNRNDDEAEKRKRRKSTKLSLPNLDDEPQAGPSSDGPDVPRDAPAGHGRQPQRLQSVAQIPVVNVPLDVMSSNFEEWMKMATDNKINAANSWNFALIDYFHDMSLLRNTSDNSINFQRASCTLDGCVKIWTSRVDSVGTETGKLLSNLAQEGKISPDDDGEIDSDNPDAGEGGAARKRKSHRAESTLAKNAAQLKSKKLDLEFSVDPLFKKTCADFDEGGAQGLLMNHLGLAVGSDGGLRIVFDASDSVAKSEEEEAQEEDPEEEVDLRDLRSQFLSDLEVLEEKAISHSLAAFSFSKDAFSFDETTFLHQTGNLDGDDSDNDEPLAGGLDGDMANDFGGGGDAAAEDFFVGDQAVGDDFGGGDMPMDDFGPGDEEGEEGSGRVAAHAGPPGGGGPMGTTFVPFDPRRAPNERDLMMAMTDADGGMLDYFDQAFLKNWAGPEHWKLRKIVRKPDTTDAAGPKPRREKKDPFKLDFTTPLEKDLKEVAKELFAPVTRGAGINLPGTSSAAKGRKGKGKKGKEKEKDAHLLPDDMHFSSRQLVGLFLKPKFLLTMRGQRVRLDGNGDGEIDENFWAQAAANQAAGQDGDDADETAGGGAIPFNTQFFHDDYDDGPGFDDVYDDGGVGGSAALADPGEQDLLAATQGQTRRVRPEFVNYAKRAKRVDVRKLKENIWKGLDIVVPDEKDADADEMDVDEGDKGATDPAEARVFSNVVSGLRSSYPREKMEEISTSFCFICLLHLANERGLKLEVSQGGVGAIEDPAVAAEAEAEAEKREGGKVGNIWGLKVYRDPDASPAA